MDSREVIIHAAIELINEKGEGIGDITVREICKRAGVGLGLVNYHFGSKEKLIEACVERMINGVVESFCSIQEQASGMTPLEKLEHLGNMTLTFLFDHHALSRISILTDMNSPKEDDNTHRTWRAYLPLVSACRPDWDGREVKRRTFCLITVMQQAFLRHGELLRTQGVDLKDERERRDFHSQILKDILEM